MSSIPPEPDPPGEQQAVPEHAGPDYDLDDLRIVTGTKELKALFHPLRDTVLDLLTERAATVAELAEAVQRPASSVAYHVDVLADAGLVKVVRTRKVRAVEERFFGRTARTFYVGEIRPDQLGLIENYLHRAAREAEPALQADRLRAILRHARISEDDAERFWRRIFEVVDEFSSLPRAGEQTFGFVAGLYPTDQPSLPEPGA
jgi:DNA-binding transcriptional ArsR family regulator